MSELHASIPIQYIIETKSDWTRFSIIENGFSWSNIELEYLKGADKLAQDIMFSEKAILITKMQWDKSLVRIRVNCKLNVQAGHFGSIIRYVIEKGDLNYTNVRIFFKGKEINCLENTERVDGNPNNPKEFSVSIPKLPRRGMLGRMLSWSYVFLKIASLFGLSFLIVFAVSYVYCYALSFDFLETAKANTNVFILGSIALFTSFLAIGSKRNWI